MATLSTQVIDSDGVTPSYSAASGGGDVAANDGNQYLHVLNGGGGSIDVTITAQNTTFFTKSQGTFTRSDKVVSVGAGAEAKIAGFAPSVFNNSSGQIEIAYSGTTSVTVGWFELNKDIR